MPGGRRCAPISKSRCGSAVWSTSSPCPMKPSRPVSIQPDIAMTASSDAMSASDIAQAVAARKMSAAEVIEAALARIRRHDQVLNSFTDVTAERARARARDIDAAIGAGKSVGPLAGVPFAVKNLFDRSEEHTSELQSLRHLVCRLLLEKKNT